MRGWDGVVTIKDDDGNVIYTSESNKLYMTEFLVFDSGTFPMNPFAWLWRAVVPFARYPIPPQHRWAEVDGMVCIVYIRSSIWQRQQQ